MPISIIPRPHSAEQTGIRRSFIEDLALKTLYLERELTLQELAAKLHVSPQIIQDVYHALRKQQWCEVKGMDEGTPRIAPSGPGATRASTLFSLSQYVGPAPVSYDDYITRIRAQSVRDLEVRHHDLEHAFSHLVLSREILDQLGAAIVSGTSTFLYGPTGTGKTSIAESLPSAYHDAVWIPYALEVDGQVIVIYDPIIHRRLEQPEHEDYDDRWVLCERPRVMVGGELTIDMLDLQFNPVSKFYSAPPQMKANNGVFILDDFGRQRIRPEELLNRWTVPLDRRIDFLTLMGGRKLEIPFDLFVVFATNLDPRQLADEAFLRRIHNKIKVECMKREMFHEVFRRLCDRYGMKYDQGVVELVIDMVQSEFNQPLRACYPLDIILQIRWSAQYQGKPALLNRETATRACRNYFISPGSAEIPSQRLNTTLHQG